MRGGKTKARGKDRRDGGVDPQPWGTILIVLATASSGTALKSEHWWSHGSWCWWVGQREEGTRVPRVGQPCLPPTRPDIADARQRVVKDRRLETHRPRSGELGELVAWHPLDGRSLSGTRPVRG